MEELNVEKMNCHGHVVKIRYLGTGRFEKIVMCDKDGEELYHVRKEISGLSSDEDYLIERREYFEDVLRRKYTGWRNSFIEFCRETAKRKNFPRLIIYGYVMVKLRLSMKATKIYAEYYEKFFGKGK
ncbi:MAG: hypothetical protein WCX17_02600 [Parcubacteria group bacterium]|jgi:hypothetical protein